MKGFLSLVLVSIALLQMTAASPTASERSQGISLVALTLFSHVLLTLFNIDDVAVNKREGEQNVEKRSFWLGYYTPDEALDNPEA
ncbi:hypothetical protein BDR03DRAFT_964543 [Suillus americanus]|nr:hypothetical protein BDR03DRAFT_964543 [Suillus americanus]